MWNWDQFKNLPRISSLPDHEQARQFFLYKSNHYFESAAANASASSSAGAGAGAGGGRYVDPNSVSDFSFEEITFEGGNADSHEIFSYDPQFNKTSFELSDDLDGLLMVAKNTDDNLNYFMNFSDINFDSFDFGTIDHNGQINYIETGVALPFLGGAVLNVNYEDSTITAASDGTYADITPSSSGVGAGLVLTVLISEGAVVEVTIIRGGDLYKAGDEITISGDFFGDSSETYLTIIVTTIENTYKQGSSFIYNGNDQFIYCDGLYLMASADDGECQKMVTITTTGEVELLKIHDIIGMGYAITSIFKYNDQDYTMGTPVNYPLLGLSASPEGVGLMTQDVHELMTFSNITEGSYKIMFATGTIVINNDVYASFFIMDKDAGNMVNHLGKINMETFEVESIHILHTIVFNGEDTGERFAALQIVKLK